MIARVIQKLAGRDFNLDDDSFDELSVKEQVEKLINEATSLEHLCIMYHGWMHIRPTKQFGRLAS